MTRRAIGEVRPSQVITTFGPGAIVDLESLSVIVAGIDHWPINEDYVIHEPRLERALRVDRFFPALPSEGSYAARRGTVPAYLFPRFQVCPVCQTLSTPEEELTEYVATWQEVQCKAPGCRGRGKRRATTNPAPFIVACPAGHIDDFPWRPYVHRGPTNCRKQMKLFAVGQTGTVHDIKVQCECGQTRAASDAFGEDRASAMGECARKRPWLGPTNQDAAACPNSGDVRALQRGATNAWFPVVRSALKVREAATQLGVALDSCNPRQIERIDSLDKLGSYVQDGMFPSLERFEVEEVWEAIRRRRGEVETEEIDLRWPEWLAFHDPGASKDQDEFFLEQGTVPIGFEDVLARVILARKLLEVRALVGFTRIDAAGAGTDDAVGQGIAPIASNRSNWMPAVEVRGEGIFLELAESSVAEWERRPEVQTRSKAMAEKFREWEAERGTPPSVFPGARYALLHSFAHALIRQLSLDCGYSASSVRERIYSSSDPARPMAGVLLYTASADSEGSLGGLVELGSADRLPGLLHDALQSSAICSSDPLCAGHQPDVHATINGAACHACILASETSCESFNRFLDRSFLVPTMAGQTLAFFRLGEGSGE